jgi:hypothetical protein
VVYPSIHGEPFGMVPIEAMAQATPVIVPDQGGVAGLTKVGEARGGLRFQTWDSGDLARQIEQLCSDAKVHADLSEGALRIADYFSVARMGDRILDHLELPRYGDGYGEPKLRCTEAVKNSNQGDFLIERRRRRISIKTASPREVTRNQ